MNRFVAITTTLTAGLLLNAADPVDFKKQVRPILEVHCLKCHGTEKPKGDLVMVTRADTIKGVRVARPWCRATRPRAKFTQRPLCPTGTMT